MGECTGTLISPTVFLTAAHCDEGVSRVAVTFDSTYAARRARPTRARTRRPRTTRRRATRTTSPSSSSTSRSRGSRRRGCRRPTRSAPCRQRRAVHAGRLRRPGGESGRRPDVPLRRRALRRRPDAQLLNPSWLRISMNPSHGRRRHVLRRLRRPELPRRRSDRDRHRRRHDDHRRLPCRSTNVDYRLDTASARTFLGQFVTLP